MGLGLFSFELRFSLVLVWGGGGCFTVLQVRGLQDLEGCSNGSCGIGVPWGCFKEFCMGTMHGVF